MTNLEAYEKVKESKGSFDTCDELIQIKKALEELEELKKELVNCKNALDKACLKCFPCFMPKNAIKYAEEYKKGLLNEKTD